MAKLSGWQKVGLAAGAGCATILGVLVIGALGAVFWARSTMAQYGDTTPSQVDRTIPLAAPASVAPQGAGGTGSRSGARPAGDGPSAVRLDLEDGRFTIEPGEPGDELQVVGSYAPGLYELSHDGGLGGAGERGATVRFRSKAPAWVRMLSGIGRDSAQPRLTIRIPQRAPIDLDVRVAMGESRIDLGQLTLRDLALDLTMGEHRVDFGAPVAEGVRRLHLNASMGNVSLVNVGNARPETVEVTGSMGELTADLGGAWNPGSTTELSFMQSMGELRVNVPTNVRLDANVRSRDEADAPFGGTEAAGPDAPVLRVRVTSSMGNARIDRYPR